MGATRQLGRNIETVFRLMPIQEGILYHSLMLEAPGTLQRRACQRNRWMADRNLPEDEPRSLRSQPVDRGPTKNHPAKQPQRINTVDQEPLTMFSIDRFSVTGKAEQWN